MPIETDDLKDLFEEKYKRKLNISFDEWMDEAPTTEDEAYARLDAINASLEDSYDEWFESTGSKRDDLEEERDRLKTEYDLIEAMFGLENKDN